MNATPPAPPTQGSDPMVVLKDFTKTLLSRTVAQPWCCKGHILARLDCDYCDEEFSIWACVIVEESRRSGEENP